MDKADLTLSMRAAAPEVQEVILRNMSTRAAAMAREDVAALAPTRLTVVHEVQDRIVAIVCQLQASDEIVINRGGADELVASPLARSLVLPIGPRVRQCATHEAAVPAGYEEGDPDADREVERILRRAGQHGRRHPLD